MKEFLVFTGKVLVAMVIINAVSGLLGFGGIIANPLAFFKKPAA